MSPTLPLRLVDTTRSTSSGPPAQLSHELSGVAVDTSYADRRRCVTAETAVGWFLIVIGLTYSETESKP